jgi:membrane protein DedA with SNARE-associated domain
VFPLVILLVMIGSFAREVIEREGYDDPRLFVVAAVAVVVVIAAVFLALRKARQRRLRR